MQAKPFVKLVGEDGNAFAILARCFSAARKAKWTPEQITLFKNEATAGDYDHLLRVVLKHFDEESTKDQEENYDEPCNECGEEGCTGQCLNADLDEEE